MEETENGGDIRDLGSIPGFGRSVEKEMATHSSILAEKIQWTEEPGGYSPWGHKVRHSWETNTFTFILKDHVQFVINRIRIVMDTIRYQNSWQRNNFRYFGEEIFKNITFAWVSTHIHPKSLTPLYYFCFIQLSLLKKKKKKKKENYWECD